MLVLYDNRRMEVWGRKDGSGGACKRPVGWLRFRVVAQFKYIVADVGPAGGILKLAADTKL